MKNDFSVMRICKTLKISRAAYYAWKASPVSSRDLANSTLLTQIREIHQKSNRRFGSPSVLMKLKEQGIHCNHKRIERLMKENQIYSKVKKKFKITTDSNHKFSICPNLVERDFSPQKVNTLWCSDITYIRTGEGWLYLAVVIDLFSRKVIGWSMSESMSRALVIDSFMMAWSKRGKPENLVYHSDRGSQYASHDFQNLLKNLNVKQSMSRKANCWDNACAESFFASLKKEEVYQQKYQTRVEAKACVFEYIEIFYNAYRPHSFTTGLSPNQYEDMKSKEQVA